MDKTSIQNITLKDITDKGTYRYTITKLKKLGINKKTATKKQISEICLEWAEMTFKGNTSLVSQRVKKRLNQINIDEIKKKVEEIYKTSANPKLKDVMPKKAFQTIITQSVLLKYFLIEIQYSCSLIADKGGEIVPGVYECQSDLLKLIYEKAATINALKENDVIFLPNTPATQLMATSITKMKIANGANSMYGYGIDGLRNFSDELNATTNHKATVTTAIKDGKRVTKLTQKRKNATSETEIEIAFFDFDTTLKNSNKHTVKLFYYILTKGLQLYDQKNGTMAQHTTQFNLSELVDIGMFNSIDTARREVSKSLDALVTLRAGVKYKKKRNQTKRDFMDIPIFTKKGIKNNVVTVQYYIDEKPLHWGFLFDYYTTLPDYAFKLSEKTFNLLQHIYATARQGKTKASFEIIARQLNLPNVEDTTQVSRDILNPIEKAVTEIEDIQTNGLKLELHYNETETRAEQARNGYLLFELPQEEQERFNEIKKNKVKKIEQIEKSKLKATGKKQAEKELKKD